MNDLISRQALLDKLQKNLREYVSVGIPRSAEPIIRMFLETIKSLQSAQPEHRWIQVSQMLPEENETVIASTKYSVYPEAHYTKEYGWEWAYEAGSDYWVELKNVVAWMPLPECYREEE